MRDVNLSAETLATDVMEPVQEPKLNEMPMWETPTLEDVSEQVMAQPYIRFT